MSKRQNSLLLIMVSVAILMLMIVSRDHFGKLKTDDDAAPTPSLSAKLSGEAIRSKGLSVYNANCLSCHGVEGRGTSFGPALMHRMYHLPRYSDQAFTQAVLYGAKQRHWQDGDMPAFEALSQTDIALISAYIRQLQKALPTR